MKAKLLYRLVFLLVITFFFLSKTAHSDSKVLEDIKILDRQIETLRERLNQDQHKRSDLVILLGQSEKTMGVLENDINQTRSAISENEESLEKTVVDQFKILQDIQESQADVSKTFQQIWMLGRRSELQLLLSNQNLSKLSRNLSFYRFILSSQIHAIKSYQTKSTKLEAVKVELEESQASLSSKRKILKLKRTSMVDLSEMRLGILKRLNEDILGGQKQLKVLQANRSKLEELLDKLEKDHLPKNNGSFLSMKGRLPWPVIGKIRNDFGESRHEGKMRWQGVTINSKEGQKVHAIHHGQIVYADWFRGLGLLTIIDHADGFMSLYAHNSSLDKDLGDWVTPGMEIATVGKSGGNEETFLYFEIRHDGKPTDPMLWCK